MTLPFPSTRTSDRPADYCRMPVEASLPMPVQPVTGASRTSLTSPLSIRVHRSITIALTGLLVATGLVLMGQAFAPRSLTLAEWVGLGLYGALFIWIAFAAAKTVTALIWPVGKVNTRMPNGPLQTRTALLMPVYAEDPRGWAGSLEAMARELSEAGHARSFELFVLSDTRDQASAAREARAVRRLAKRLAGVMPVWYRRREDNIGRKAGNVADWVRRWGGWYDHMIVLDADSVMTAEAMLRLADAMERDPAAGIVQTVPRLVGAQTVFGRLQQFANRLYGPSVAFGHAIWQHRDGNYWGHNAIIRTRAFAETCGLPSLPGAKPFGGDVLSHDFVEAAFMRRAGWSVVLATDITGSYEGCPPTLLDAAKRDRRWAQGNLQHVAFVRAGGTPWMNRVHMIDGIMGYAAAPLWLGFIIAGLLLPNATFLEGGLIVSAAQASEPGHLQVDHTSAAAAFVFTVSVLLFPRLIGLTDALANRALRQQFGGSLRLIASWLLELVVSTLLAPIFMMLHSRHVFDILRGRDTGWATQTRAGTSLPWLEALRLHASHVLLGLGILAVAAVLIPSGVWWLLPTVLGLLLAPALAVIGSGPRVGGQLGRWGLLQSEDPAAIRLHAAGTRLGKGYGATARPTAKLTPRKAGRLPAKPIDRRHIPLFARAA